MPPKSPHANDPIVDRRGPFSERVDFNQIPRSELIKDPEGAAYVVYHEKTGTRYPMPPHIYDMMFPDAIEENRIALANLKIGEDSKPVEIAVHPDSIAAMILNAEGKPQKSEELRLAINSDLSEPVVIDTGSHDGRIQSVVLQKTGTFRRSRFAHSA